MGFKKKFISDYYIRLWIVCIQKPLKAGNKNKNQHVDCSTQT